MARAGAKGAITADPLDFTGWPEPGWERLVRFAEEFIVVPKGVGAGEPFVLRPWQVEIVKGLFPEKDRPRTGLVSLPRGNGKTTLAATLALYDLFASGTVSPPETRRAEWITVTGAALTRPRYPARRPAGPPRSRTGPRSVMRGRRSRHPLLCLPGRDWR